MRPEMVKSTIALCRGNGLSWEQTFRVCLEIINRRTTTLNQTKDKTHDKH